ncbi:MAG: hypothetical protein ABEJ28_07975 [Salinigranum sp.]
MYFGDVPSLMEWPSITDPDGVTTYLYAAIILGAIAAFVLIYVGFL